MFIIYVTILVFYKTKIYTFRRAYITALIILKVTIFKEYTNYIDIFSSDLTKKLLHYTTINNHSINLKKINIYLMSISIIWS